MTRSAESIKRRIDKRGRSEGQPNKASAKNRSNAADPKLISGWGWSCSACKNRNFSSRIECNRCGRQKIFCRKLPVQSTTIAAGANTGSGSISSSELKSLTTVSANTGNGWEVQASEERMLANELLRGLCMTIEQGNANQELMAQWNALDDELKARGKMLVERSKRKSNRKQEKKKDPKRGR